MADTVTTQYQANGFRNAVVVLTNLSDGTGENNVLKVDASSAGPLGVNKAGQVFYPGTHLAIWRIDYDIAGMAVRLQWDGSPNQDILTLGPGSQYFRDFAEVGGLRVPAGMTLPTGGIRLSTINAQAGSTYWICLYLKKNV
jgi:hypothetical protein